MPAVMEDRTNPKIVCAGARSPPLLAPFESRPAQSQHSQRIGARES
jgi:hypothetical protein